MWQKYNLDFETQYDALTHTPTETGKKLPLYATSIGHYVAKKDYYTRRQGLDEYLIIYTVSGEGCLKVSGEVKQLKKEQAVLINCNDYHEYHPVGNEIWEFKYVHFNGCCAREYFNILNEKGTKIINVNKRRNISEQIDTIKAMLSSNTVLPDINACQQLVALLTDLIIADKSGGSAGIVRKYEQDVLNAINYIKINYKNIITIDDISEIVHYSKYHFIKIFKNYTGSNPHEYLNIYRITKAKELLLTSDLSINEIATAVGFFDSNGFRKRFKKIVGITPSEFRSSQ
jgi:AraC-type DNA-binding domain-containing proteins